MKKPIRVSKLLDNNLGSRLEEELKELNPNTKLWVSDKEPIDIDSLTILELEILLNKKKTEIVFKACDELIALAKKYGKKLYILYEDEVDQYLRDYVLEGE
jgi:hypothetical protein